MGSTLLYSAVVSYDITCFRVRAAISIRLDSTVLGNGAKKTLSKLWFNNYPHRVVHIWSLASVYARDGLFI